MNLPDSENERLHRMIEEQEKALKAANVQITALEAQLAQAKAELADAKASSKTWREFAHTWMYHHQQDEAA